ncbi:MAG: flagellar hook assembly protein FlgD [Gammaproteobacteria bacterium]|nr:flagellar hook assembly protein FlgD [Gammaproteobacteria bacterium]
MSEIDSKQIYTDLGLNKTQTSTTKGNDELGQAEFLELMTKQLEFQDPLEPMENGDFIAQMAQFSATSGIADLNTAFSEMSTAFQSNQALQASTMVGRDVLISGNQVRLESDGNIAMAVDLNQSASSVRVNITDASGQLVHQVDLGSQPAGLIDFQWDGLGANGERVNSGLYNITAEINENGSIVVGETLVSVQVESVTLGQAGQDLTLTVSDQGDINMSQIRKIM